MKKVNEASFIGGLVKFFIKKHQEKKKVEAKAIKKKVKDLAIVHNKAQKASLNAWQKTYGKNIERVKAGKPEFGTPSKKDAAKKPMDHLDPEQRKQELKIRKLNEPIKLDTKPKNAWLFGEEKMSYDPKAFSEKLLNDVKNHLNTLTEGNDKIVAASVRDGDGVERVQRRRVDNHQHGRTVAPYAIDDIVIPNSGPHKGEKHKVIHVFDDGRVNIIPLGSKNRYRLGAAGATPKDLEKVDESYIEEANHKNSKISMKKLKAMSPKERKAYVDSMKSAAVARTTKPKKTKEEIKKIKDEEPKAEKSPLLRIQNHPDAGRIKTAVATIKNQDHRQLYMTLVSNAIKSLKHKEVEDLIQNPSAKVKAHVEKNKKTITLPKITGINK